MGRRMLRKASSAVLSAVSICGTLAAFSGDKAVSIGAQGLRVACIPILLLALALGHNAYCRQAQAVSVVQTTADQKQLLQSQPAIAFNGAKGGAFTITVTDVARQPFDGVGAALTDSGAWLIANKLSSDQRSDLLHSLFSPEGAGLDVLTTGMSGSGYDVNGPASFTYDDIPSGTDFPQRHFSVKHDDAYIVPVLHQILRLNPKLKLFAVPYSAPAWMKNSDKLDTGSLIAKPAYERSFATYFVKYVQAYRKRNISIYALLIQNEPDYVSGTYPSMLLPAAVEGRIIAYLGPALKKAGFGSVKILGWDHNWSVPDGSEEHGDRRVLNVSGGDDGIMYPEALFARRRVKSYLAGTAYHCYGGAPATQLVLKHKFPKKGIWNTECAGGSLKQAWVKAFDRNMAHKILPEIQDWSRSHVWWTLVQDQNFGPESGNCTSAACSPLVLIDTRASRAKIVYLPGYYMLAQIGRFVRPGAYCVESHDNGIPEAAFRNPDGSLILVAYNGNEHDTKITVNWSGSSFIYAMPPHAITTFTWKSAPASN